MNRKSILYLIAGILLVLIVAAVIMVYPFFKFYSPGASEQIGAGLTILKAGGGNSGILVTDSAVVVIDTKMGNNAKRLFDTVQKLAGSKPVIVINTHYHGDHANGNKLFKGARIYMGAYSTAFLEKEMDQENRPTNLVKDSLCLFLGRDTIAIYNLGQGHTWNDMVVLLKNRKVLFTGDLVFHKVNPYLGEEAGADLKKWMEALDRIIALPGVEILVPGHGEPGDISIAGEMKSYFTDMSLAAADPSKEKEMIAKYKDWTTVKPALSPENTIEFIRK